MTTPRLTYFPLDHDVVAFSSTRHGGVGCGCYSSFNITHYCGDSPQAVGENRERLASVLQIPVDRIVLPRQTHGTGIRIVDERFFALPESEQSRLLEGVDAVLTHLPETCIGVSTADCIPVLLYDKVHRAVAAIHAGWRGTVRRIVVKAVESMTQAYGAASADLHAVVGPGISLESFEVGDEVYDEFAGQGFDMSAIAKREEKWHIDLPECNRLQLVQTGVKAGNILMSGICTYRQSSDYFSARRLGIASGRIYTGIMIK